MLTTRKLRRGRSFLKKGTYKFSEKVMSDLLIDNVHQNKKGFTIVELLIVVTIIGVLAGVTISVINVNQKMNNAKDGVIRSNLEKLVQSIEAYCAGENYCPAPAEINDPASTLMKVYVLTWPTDATYNYKNNGTAPLFANATTFELYVPLLSDTTSTKYLKYNSTWGSIKTCTDAGIGTFGVCN